jgi:hypothetical protein
VFSYATTEEVARDARRMAAELRAAGAGEVADLLENHVSSFWTTSTEFLVELLSLLDAVRPTVPSSVQDRLSVLYAGAKHLANLR